MGDEYTRPVRCESFLDFSRGFPVVVRVTDEYSRHARHSERVWGEIECVGLFVDGYRYCSWARILTRKITCDFSRWKGE